MAKLMEYQGYYGSMEASPEDGCLYGKVEFINALVNYEAETVPQLVTAFHEAVDDYLATCAQLGREPEKPCKGSFNVRVGHEVHMQAVLAARDVGVSLNDFTKLALENQMQALQAACALGVSLSDFNKLRPKELKAHLQHEPGHPGLVGG